MSVKTNGDKTFIKITNKDIYLKLEALETVVSTYCRTNVEDHAKIKGNVNLAKYMAGIALGAAGTGIAWLWQHIA